MKKEELRIGNLVALSGSLILTVYEIHEHCFYAKDAKGSSFKNTWSDLQPMPLTEEILLKCGLKQENGVMSYVLDDYSDIKIVYETLANHYRLYPYTYEILHLHQLQNLFYALTGKELEVSL